MSPFLRNVERRTMAEHEERLATVVLAEARAESERIRQRAGPAALDTETTDAAHRETLRRVRRTYARGQRRVC
jgi:hypothetical protein